MWPTLAVRTWSGVLYKREPFEYGAYDEDPYVEAEYARRLHELRGLMMAQVAEIEDLLRTLIRDAEKRMPSGGSAKKPKKPKKMTAGMALARVEAILGDLKIRDELEPQLAAVSRVVQRRNRLVHSRVHVATATMGEYGPTVPVLVLLIDHDSISEDSDPEDPLNSDIGERELENEIHEAYRALESAVDIWQRVYALLHP